MLESDVLTGQCPLPEKSEDCEGGVVEHQPWPIDTTHALPDAKVSHTSGQSWIEQQIDISIVCFDIRAKENISKDFG